MQRLGIVLKYELECLAPRSVEQLGRVEVIGRLCHAMAALEHVGMRVEGRVSGPLLKAPLDAEADHLSDREIRASEITSFLRIALKSVCDDERLQRISSHSLKRTPLAWCSKFGVSEPVRSVLGRHVSATAGSQAIYAVDLATSATKEFERVLACVATGVLNPDNPRAEYFTSRASADEGTAEVAQVKEEPGFPPPASGPQDSVVIDVSSDSDSSSSSSSSTSGSSKVQRGDWPWPLDK